MAPLATVTVAGEPEHVCGGGGGGHVRARAVPEVKGGGADCAEADIPPGPDGEAEDAALGNSGKAGTGASADADGGVRGGGDATGAFECGSAADGDCARAGRGAAGISGGDGAHGDCGGA